MYKIIIDSCGELTQLMKADGHFVSVPLELEVDGVRIVDDESFQQADFIQRVSASKTGPKSLTHMSDLNWKYRNNSAG